MTLTDLIHELRLYQAIHGPATVVTCRGRRVAGLRLTQQLVASDQPAVIVLQLEETLDVEASEPVPAPPPPAAAPVGGVSPASVSLVLSVDRDEAVPGSPLRPAEEE